MSDVLRATVRRSTPLAFIPLLLIFAVAGCSSTTSGGMGLALKKPAPAPAADSAAPGGEPQENEFVADPLGQSGQATPASKLAAKAHPKNVLKTAFSQVGNPYRYGGSKPETGFDCSGFVKWVYGQYGIGLPRSSGDMMGKGTSVARQELKPGDLVFFGKKKRITHVGIYTGDNKYIHSPSTGKKIQESSLDDRARGEYYAGARRVLKYDGRMSIDNDQKSIWVEQAEREMAVAKASVSSGANNGAPAVDTAAPAVIVAAEPALIAAAEPVSASADSEMSAKADEPQAFLVAEVKLEESKPAPAPAVKASPAKAPAAKSNAKKHQVAAGDTIYSLARKYNVTREALAKANNLEGEKAALLKLGQTLTIPASSGTAVASSGSKSPKQHKVASGDTLYDLARKYGVSADALAKANALDGKQLANLKLGQTLVIPSKNK